MTTQTSTLLQSAQHLLTSCTGLDDNSAYSLLMYCGITHIMPKLLQCPILVIRGPTETGKTTALVMSSELCHNIAGTISQPSRAIARDAMTQYSTLIIEEGDNIDELLLTSRYSVDTPIKVNRNMGNGMFTAGNMNLMGATLIHRRQTFRDPATESRCITLYTKAKTSVVRYPLGSLSIFKAIFSNMSMVFPYSSIMSLPQGRSEYNWGLLKLVANEIHSPPDWIQFVDDKIKSSKQTTVRGRESEPMNQVWAAVVELGVMFPDNITSPPQVVTHRLSLSQLTELLNKEIINYVDRFDSWQVGQLARQAGFDVKSRGGKQWLYMPTLFDIIKIGREISVDDDLVKFTV